MASFNSNRASTDNTRDSRKSLGAIVLLAPLETELLDSIIDVDGTMVDLGSLAGWESIGIFSEDGLSFTKEVEFEEVLAHGYRTYVRRDVSSETHAVTLNALAVDRKIVAELRTGMDLSGATVEPTKNEITYAVSEIEDLKNYRLLAISKDRNQKTGEEFYRAKQYRNVEVSTFPEENWNNDPIAAALEFSAKADDDGVFYDEFLGGPGADLVELGYGTGA